MSNTLLVIEDEPDLVRGLRDALGFEGYAIISADSGQRGIQRARRDKPDLIILDLMLPDINGFAVCERIRAQDPEVPILMLTARSQEADKVRGFHVGADDFVTKPFGIGELTARVQALFRRTRRCRDAAEIITIGRSRVDLRKHTVTRVQDVLPLSVYETKILRLLFERRTEPVSRDAILNTVWGMDAMPTNRTVDNFIVKLRRKLEENPRNPQHILTVYGHGYKLIP